jgi:hypothetical protein
MQKLTVKSLQDASLRDGGGGVQDGYLGTNYQFKLLELFVHDAVEACLDFDL